MWLCLVMLRLLCLLCLCCIRVAAARGQAGLAACRRLQTGRAIERLLTRACMLLLQCSSMAQAWADEWRPKKQQFSAAGKQHALVGFGRWPPSHPAPDQSPPLAQPTSSSDTVSAYRAAPGLNPSAAPAAPAAAAACSARFSSRCCASGRTMVSGRPWRTQKARATSTGSSPRRTSMRAACPSLMSTVVTSSVGRASAAPGPPLSRVGDRVTAVCAGCITAAAMVQAVLRTAMVKASVPAPLLSPAELSVGWRPRLLRRGSERCRAAPG